MEQETQRGASKSRRAETILVVAAHPDDEVLGCGGTMARHAEAGDDVHLLILGEGVTARDIRRDVAGRQRDLQRLNRAVETAADLLGVVKVHRASFPDNRFDSVDLLDVIKAVEQVFELVKPQRVYTHHAGDLNVDHRITHQAVVTAARPVPGGDVASVLAFEVPSSTDWQGAGSHVPFVPQVYVEITHTLKRKLKALAVYRSEMRPFPHARSLRALEALARVRGATVGVQAAEAFVLVRDVVHE